MHLCSQHTTHLIIQKTAASMHEGMSAQIKGLSQRKAAASNNQKRVCTFAAQNQFWRRHDPHQFQQQRSNCSSSPHVSWLKQCKALVRQVKFLAQGNNCHVVLHCTRARIALQLSSAHDDPQLS